VHAAGAVRVILTVASRRKQDQFGCRWRTDAFGGTRSERMVEFRIAGWGGRFYDVRMTKATAQLLEKVRKLPAAERRELCEAILREGVAGPRRSAAVKRRIADVAGKYTPNVDAGGADHDRGFAEAIIASKGRSKAA
jgi:hypothetical protein